jgi:hypothetical protein
MQTVMSKSHIHGRYSPLYRALVLVLSGSRQPSNGFCFVQALQASSRLALRSVIKVSAWRIDRDATTERRSICHALGAVDIR